MRFSCHPIAPTETSFNDPVFYREVKEKQDDYTVKVIISFTYRWHLNEWKSTTLLELLTYMALAWPFAKCYKYI